jgi:hypothetical protein
MNKVLLALAFLTILSKVYCNRCPVEEDPSDLARCIQIDVTAIIYAARGKDDLSALCAMADRYMECIKTYTRGCIGFYVIKRPFPCLKNFKMIKNK